MTRKTSRLPKHGRLREGRSARAPKNEAEKHANAFAKEVLLGPGGLAPYHGLSDSASIKAAAQARGACPGVVVNLMHRNHTLDYKWCNDLLVDMDIPFVGWRLKGWVPGY